MTYIMIRVGDETVIFANADCCTRVLMDWVREKVVTWLPPTASIELDLCDDAGNIRLLTELPPTTNALLILQPNNIYHPVVRGDDGKFKLLQPSMARDHRYAEMQQRINRGNIIWKRIKAKLESEPSFDKLVEMIQKAIVRSAKNMTSDGWERGRDRGVMSTKRDRKSSRQNSTGPQEHRSARRGSISSGGGSTAGDSRPNSDLEHATTTSHNRRRTSVH